MYYLAKVLIGRAVVSLDRPFDYVTEDNSIVPGMRVLVPFGKSVRTIGFVLEELVPIGEDLEAYERENERKLSRILEKVDESPLLSPALLALAKEMATYYTTDLIRILDAFLPPSLKPKDSALKKSKGRTIDYVKRTDRQPKDLTKNEKALYERIALHKEGLRRSDITAKKALDGLLSKEAVLIEKVPLTKIPEIVASSLADFDLTESQREAYDTMLQNPDKVALFKGVTGSGKTEVYLKLAKDYLDRSRGVLVLIPEIALTDQMANRFYSYFKDTIAILHSGLSDSRRYEEYRRIASGECKIVLGTRSAIFAPVKDLGLILIDEEHSNTYKQDNAPYYDAVKVALMRRDIEHVQVVLGSATPRVIDNARAEKGVFLPVCLSLRYAASQEKDIQIVDMNQSGAFDPAKSSLISSALFEEIGKTLQKKEQAMVLINRRGYAPIYICRNCHTTALCPNCGIPLNYHKRTNELLCHHCGYKTSASTYVCACGEKEFLPLGYGTERAYEDLRAFFPKANILRIDSDITGSERRHEILQSFADGECDILVGTQIIAKGHDFPNVTLAALLDADSPLRLPTYLASEEAFDLISQFVGRAGRGKKKGRVLIQTFSPGNETIQLAAKQDYETFYRKEMDERRKYQFPPYTYLTLLTVRAMDSKRCREVSYALKDLLIDKVGQKRINIYGPSLPYIPSINGRYYRNILLKYKSQDERIELLSHLKAFRMANKDAEVLVDVDPGTEGI